MNRTNVCKSCLKDVPRRKGKSIEFKQLNLELDAKNEELRKTLEETQNIRERLNCILESLKSGVVVVDVEGCITHFNRAAEKTDFKASFNVLAPTGWLPVTLMLSS